MPPTNLRQKSDRMRENPSKNRLSESDKRFRQHHTCCAAFTQQQWLSEGSFY